MSVHDLLTTFAIVGVPVGLISGLALGPRAAADSGYGSFARRARRLGHVALVMLPVIGGLYAQALAPVGTLALVAAWLWIGGAVALVVTLFTIARRPDWKAVIALPACALTTASVLFAVAYLNQGGV